MSTEKSESGKLLAYSGLFASAVLALFGGLLIVSREIVKISHREGGVIKWEEYAWYIRAEWAPVAGIVLFLLSATVFVILYMFSMKNYWLDKLKQLEDMN